MQQLGDYKLIEKIGAGGMGEVWLAENVHMHKRYALKLLPEAATRDSNFVARFFDEGRVMSELKHPNIVPVHHVGHDKESGRYYLVMDFVAGADGESQSLHDLLQASADNRLPEADVRKWAVQIAEGLAYAHKQGIVHRDIKPANILIDADNNARIADFGLAKAVGDEYIQTQIHQSIQHSMSGSLGDQPTIPNAGAERKRSSGSRPIEDTLDGLNTIQPGQSSHGTHRSTAESILGTYDYMSPEQRNELPNTPVGPPSDIYAYGVMLYRLLTGRRPTGRVKPVSQTVPGLSKNWDALSYRCLEHQPEDRYSNASALLIDLNRFRGGGVGKRFIKIAGWLILLVGLGIGGFAGVQGYVAYRVEQQETAAQQIADRDAAAEREATEEKVRIAEQVSRETARIVAAKEEKRRAEAARVAAAEKRKTESSRVAAEEKRKAEAARIAAVEKAKRDRIDQNLTVAQDATGSPLGTRMYRVQKGDVGYWTIAEKVWGEGKGRYWKKIQDANPGVVSSSFVAGMMLKIPALEEATTTATAGTASGSPKPGSMFINSAGQKVYVVSKDDTAGMWGIAEKLYGHGKYHILLQKANQTAEVVAFKVGQHLVIPPNPPTSSTTPAATAKAASVAEALAKLTPSIIIEVLVDGKKVPATISDGRRSFTAPANLTLAENTKYAFTVHYKTATKRYGSKVIHITADWKGPKTQRITLIEQKLPRGLEAVASASLASLTGLASGSNEAQARQKEAVAKGMPLEVKLKKTGIRFRLIPKGSFMMGSPANEKKRDDDEVSHRVTLTKPFYMGKFEVTQGQWEKVMGSNRSRLKKAGKNAPVEQVTWNRIQTFLKKLEQLEGLPKGSLKLPTEAQWEYACRAGTTTTFCYGDSLDSSMANFRGDYPYGNGRKGIDRKTTTPVGQFKPNSWGLYDMHGNVYEWCEDWYGEDYDSSPKENPKGPNNGKYRVLRGGSWCDVAWNCRSADRYRYAPVYRLLYGFGFRLSLDFTP